MAGWKDPPQAVASQGQDATCVHDVTSPLVKRHGTNLPLKV